MVPGENLLKSMQRKSAISIYNKYFLYFIIFFLPFITYLTTLAVNVIPEDSGELSTASFSLGIPHPPGYPLWLLVSKLFLFIPIKTIIYRTNLVSAFFSALTVLLLFHLLYRYTKKVIPSIAMSLCFAFSRIMWSQSVIAEVYTLNAFLLILYIFITEKTLDNFKYIKLLSFLSGLLAVSHYSNFLIILPVIFIMWMKYKNRIFNIKIILWGIFPLTLFLVLLIRANAEPLINWGNPSTFTDLLFHILRLSFGSMISRSARSFYLFVKQIKMFVNMYILQFGILTGLIILWLSIMSIKHINSKIIKYLFIMLLLFTSVGVILILNFKTDEESFFINRVFFIPFFMILIYSTKYYIVRLKHSKFLLILPFLLFFVNFKYNNRAGEYYTLKYNRNILKSVNYKSTLFTAKDFSTFPLLYYTKVEYRRPDLKIYDWFGNVFDDIFHNKEFHLLPKYKRDEIRERVSDNIRKNNPFETYYSFQRATLKEIKSLGIVYSYNKNLPEIDFNYFDDLNTSTNNIKYMDYFLKNMISVYYFHLGFFYKQEGDSEKSRYYFELSNKFGGNKAKELLNLAVNAMKEKKFNEALDLLNQAISSDSELDLPYLYKANILFQMGEYKEAEKNYLLCINKNVLNAMAYNNLGSLYIKLNYPLKAIEIYRRGLITGYWKIYNNLAMMYIKNNKLTEAEKLLIEGIEKTPEAVNLYLNLSVVLSRLNRWNEAGVWLERCMKYNTENYKVYLNLGLIYIKTGRQEKAKQLFAEAMNKFPAVKEFKYYYEKL